MAAAEPGESLVTEGIRTLSPFEISAPRAARHLVPAIPGIWKFEGWAGRGVRAGLVDRHAAGSTLRAHLPRGTHLVQAEQVHGSSLAVIDRSGRACVRREPSGAGPQAADDTDESSTVPGCDALLTQSAHTAIVIRTADCVPVFVNDPVRRAVGLAHVGWRGLASDLPWRLMAAFQRAFNSRPRDVRVAFGPSIRSCCYEVSADFPRRFGARFREESFRRDGQGRLTCDLTGLIRRQLLGSGVPSASVTDCGDCTGCHTDRWYSVRREGEATGRMLSFIMLSG